FLKEKRETQARIREVKMRKLEQKQKQPRHCHDTHCKMHTLQTPREATTHCFYWLHVVVAVMWLFCLSLSAFLSFFLSFCVTLPLSPPPPPPTLGRESCVARV